MCNETSFVNVGTVNRREYMYEELAKDLRPFKTFDSVPLFLFKWAALSAVVLGVSLMILPWEHNLLDRNEDLIFHVENISWALLSLSSGLALYFRSFPDKRTDLFENISLFLITGLFGLTFYHNGYSFFLSEATNELDLWRGRCGFIILGLAALHTTALVFWAKKGASSSPRHSGLFAALSAAALGCLLMQTVCNHDNSLHLIIWHFVPLAGICYVCQRFVSSKLSW